MSQFATVAQLGVRIGKTIAAASQEETTATELLREASSLIQAHTGQLFDAVANETVLLTADGSEWLTLPQRPVTAVSALSIDGTALATPGEYLWDADGNLSRVSTSWWSPNRRSVSVTYSHGYAVDGNGITLVPAQVRTICLNMVARVYLGRLVTRRATGTPDTEGNPVVQNVREPVDLALTEDEKQILSDFASTVFA